MSIYLEFPSIQDYPEYCPMEKVIAYLSCWGLNAMESATLASEDDGVTEKKLTSIAEWV